jgi:hypothetical protein
MQASNFGIAFWATKLVSPNLRLFCAHFVFRRRWISAHPQKSPLCASQSRPMQHGPKHRSRRCYESPPIGEQQVDHSTSPRPPVRLGVTIEHLPPANEVYSDLPATSPRPPVRRGVTIEHLPPANEDYTRVRGPGAPWRDNRTFASGKRRLRGLAKSAIEVVRNKEV